MMGGGSKEAAPAAPAEAQAPAAAAPYQAPPGDQQQQPNPCANELKQFIQCAQNQTDLGLCQGFSMALKECRITYGLPPGGQ